MPINDPILTRQLEQLRARFSDFRNFRKDSWDPIINRRAAVTIDPSIAAFATGVDLQLPDAEQALHDHTKILMLSQPKIDAVALDTSKDARKDVEDIRQWSAASWLRQDDGLWIDHVVASGQVQHGVAIMRKHWQMPAEPDPEKLKQYRTGDGDTADLKARESYYREEGEHPFWWTHVGFDQVAWWPLTDPTIVIQESIIPYVEAKRLTTQDGKKHLTMSKLKKIAFVGDPEGADEWENASADEMPNVRLIIRDAKDPKTGRWKCTEYVVPDGAALTEDGEKFREYDNPLGMSMYFIVASGDERLSETDPHLRYRPRLYSLLVDIQQYNYLATLIAALAHKKVSDEDVYIDISKLTPEALASMEEWGLIEGVGAQRRLVMRRPDPGSGEMSVMPTLTKWPNDLEPHLMLLLQETKEAIARHQPNRFLTGTAYQETREATGTAYLDARQSAGLPPGADLVKSSQFIRRGLEAEHNAIRFWDEATPAGAMKPYPITTTGDEPVLKGTVEAGTTVTLTAEKLKRKFIIQVQTKNETQAEKAQNDLMAYQDFNAGTIDDIQLLRRLGHDDPERQAELLEEFRMRKLFEPRYAQIEMQMVETYMTALTGMNLSELAGGQVPMQQQQQGNAAPKPRQPGPQMTPAPVDGASGSSSNGMAVAV